MTHRVSALVVLVGILGVPQITQAQFHPQGWRWRTALTSPQGSGGLVALSLDAAIYDRLLTPPDDLRVVNPSGALVPHVIQCGRTAASSTVATRPVQMMNRTYTPHRFSRVVLDFGETVTKNKLKVDLSGQNYRRKVTIEGGNDGKTWETVAERLFLFDVQARDESYRVDSLTFPENSFRYLRLTIENMPDDPERVEINGVSAFYEQPAGDPQLTRVEVVNRIIEQDKKTNSTVIALDLGSRHLPIQSLALVVDDALFQRGYIVEGRNTITDKVYRRGEEAWRAQEIETPWSSVSQGIFYRTRDQGRLIEMTEMVIPHAAYRYLRVIIKNNDDQPLAIRDVTVNRRTCGILLEAQAGAQYTLYGGNGKAGAPSYDFARLVPGMDISQLPQMVRGPIEELKPEEPQVPWSERHWYVITAGVIAAVGLMLWIIIPGLKREIANDNK